MLLPPRNMENRGEGIAVMKKALRKQGKYLREILISVRESGQSVVIYALILAVVTAASAGALLSLKNNVNTTMDRAEQRIANTDIGSEESYIAIEVLQNMVVTAEDYAGSYDGDSHSGTVTVSAPASGYAIRFGSSSGSYTSETAPSYSEVGNWTVYFKITADGYHSYEGHFSVTINPRYVSIPSAYGSFTYDGTTKTATIDGYNSTYCARSGTTSAVNAGTYTVSFTLKNDTFMTWSDGTTAPKSYSWTIAKRNLNTATIGNIADQTWTGNAIKPEPTVTCNGRTLTKTTDFTYSYNNNVSPGTATVTVNAASNGNYTGYATKTFQIISRSMTVSASGYTGTYDGTAHTGTVTVTFPSSGATVYYGSSASGCNSTSPIYRTGAGTQTVYYKVTANNYTDYTGSFVITINKAKITTVPSTTATWWYTGSTVTPTWFNYDASKLTKGGTTSAVNIGSYSTTFTPTGNYTWSDGSTAAKSVSWKIAAGTGTSYYTATQYGSDRLGNSMSVTYSIREDWSYITNSSVVYVQNIRFNYYTSASNGYPQTSGGTGGDGSHNSWVSYSLAQIKVNNGSASQLLYASVGSTTYALPFNGSSSCYLTYGGSTYSSGGYSVSHDSSGNASVTIYGYWSWGTSATYPRDTRGGIHGGSSGTPAASVITLKDTKP